MIKNILFSSWLMASAPLAAQITFDLPTDYVRGQIFSINSLTNGTGYTGSPYLNDEFSSGRVYVAEDDYPALLRFNSYAGVLEIKTGDDDYGQLQEQPGMRVEVGDRNFEVVSLNGGKRVFLENLTKGTISLWAHRRAAFQPAQEGKSSYDSGRPAEFTQYTDYYIGEPGALREIKLKKKDLLESTLEREKEIIDFAKKQKIKWNDEADVIRLLNYFNGL
jgi:hypothetical protein